MTFTKRLMISAVTTLSLGVGTAMAQEGGNGGRVLGITPGEFVSREAGDG
jgi:hypothetical protein